MSTTSHIFVDSSAFVAWFFARDAHHQDAVARFDWVKTQQLMPITSSFVVDETATVLSNRDGQSLARKFLDFANTVQTIFITEEIRRDIHVLFHQQQMKGTSIVDCSNIVVMQRLSIPSIFTYDGDFTKQFHVQAVG